MALLTKSKFYFGVEITQDNNVIDIDEGGGEISVVIPVGIYSPKQIADKFSSLLTSAGSQSYTCSFNRTTRKLTISSVAPFDILISTGTHTATTLYTVLGYTGGLDLTGLTSYAAPSTTGFEYVPQFYLLDYVPLEHNVKSVQASINETGSGTVEIIRFGTKRFMECSIELITNNKFLGDSIWSSNPKGVEDTLLFLGYATQKSNIEFMPDLTDVASYSTLLLESTEVDTQGIGFKLMEQLEYGAGYYKTGKLVFREVN
ncbi:MAG: hypothetical protein IPQ08_05850 [Chitinophagaceae bacterium]|nr:hypothetical protein [Chitinophagaceae bacterium]